jgi:signal transduction histidine kinase
VADDTSFRGVKNAAGAALLESMQAAEQALARPDGLSREQVVARLQEWQLMVKELATGAARGTELAALYEIIGVMNSSLDLKETLSLVMDSLIHLTGAERGCLVLLDDEGNIEVQAAQHFDQGSVDACDLELSHTVVQEVVEGKQPVLTTNAQRDPRFSDQESVVGYMLRSIVCVPLQVHGRVIGALYLDNRARDGVFSQADLPILTAFASQAAIAIENARMYTMTHQALAARVEELTTMQQIDRELNASLDFERVLDLTLSWALRSTGAEKGTLTILDNEGTVCTVSCDGGNGATTLESDLVRLAMTSREPVLTDGQTLLVPIRYQERTVGLLFLRCNNKLVPRFDNVEFAGRLADRAAIAIENARLYEQVRQANAAKSEFISCVSHELRTPMTSIRGYAEMLEKGMVGTLSTQQMEFASTIRRNAERMQVLVSDLQDVSRIETGRMRLELAPTAVADALDSALQATQAQIDARSQHLEVEIADDMPPVYADRSRLAQILINLLSNACKYTPRGGCINVRADVQDDFVECTVTDTGVGISPQDQQSLFTKFFRSDDPAVRETPGTGLGLCIVKSLVELQGGEIEVESELGKGVTVRFTMPVATEAVMAA